MKSTESLIAELSADAPASRLGAPLSRAARLWMVWVLYAAVLQYALGLRPDLGLQFGRPLFALEIFMLVALAISSGAAAILVTYPDAYQKQRWLMLPYIVFGLLVGLIGIQMALPMDSRIVMPLPGAHTIECTICIASAALLPSCLIFLLLRRGASIRPGQAGAVAIFAATAVSCLALRLSESNDAPAHLAAYHYLPTLCFAYLGARVGKWLLKW